MKRVALLCCVVLTVACIDRSGCLTGFQCVRRFCLLAGDTIGVLIRVDSTHHVSECIWLTSDKTVCDSTVIRPVRFTCHIGDPT